MGAGEGENIVSPVTLSLPRSMTLTYSIVEVTHAYGNHLAPFIRQLILRRPITSVQLARSTTLHSELFGNLMARQPLNPSPSVNSIILGPVTTFIGWVLVDVREVLSRSLCCSFSKGVMPSPLFVAGILGFHRDCITILSQITPMFNAIYRSQ